MRFQSQTFRSLVRLLRALPDERKRSLMLLVPVAILSGVADLGVVAPVARLFTVVVGKPNRPSVPWPELVPDGPVAKVLIQRLSRGLLLELSACTDDGGNAPSLCLKTSLPQPISI